MSNIRVEQAVLQAINEVFGERRDTPRDLTKTPEALGLDSIDTVELIMIVEEELEITLDDEQVEGCKTLIELTALAERELETKRERSELEN
jgi:acyl carrier protein